MIGTAVVSGYATMDYVVAMHGDTAGFGTVPARLMIDSAWPRAGGAPLFAGARLAAAGWSVTPLVMVADDALGAAYRAACMDAGMDATGIAPTLAHTPRCVLAQHGSGGYVCYLDVADPPLQALTIEQGAAVDAAELVCIAAADPAQTRAVLARVRADQRLVWIVKADAACFPPDLCAALAPRADVIFHNVHERHFVGMARGGRPARRSAVHVETDGGRGVILHAAGITTRIDVASVDCTDATGAGDSFAGAFLGSLTASPGLSDLEAAGHAAAIAVRELLLARRPVLHGNG